MKTTQKLKLVVNELITAAYQAWLARRAEKRVRAPGQARPMTLPRSFISTAKGWSV
jgi:hypothetical protein